jgi:molecular chaperone GrpE
MQDHEPTFALPETGPAAEAGANPANPATAGAEVMPSPEEIIRQLELQVQEHHDAWLRAKAEADNIRKRAQADIASAHKFALEGFAADLLPVRDSLEAALATENISVESLREGVALTLKLLSAAFDKGQLKEVNPVGEKFDPHRHQAMTAVESDKAPNTVLHVMQKGYLLNDRVLRPALVTVARAKDA